MVNFIFGNWRHFAMERMRISRYTLLLLLISIFLFIIPFFWLKPGEMDIGGDSSRLYFYDPVKYLLSSNLYSISASAFGLETIYYFDIPFVSLLIILKSILVSPTLLISVFHGFSMSMAFIFCYLIIKELIAGEGPIIKSSKIYYSAIFGSLLYILSPATIDGWEHVLLSHNQIFLNPILFYLLLKYFKTTNINYIFITIILTFIFSPNFSIISAPAIFAFYPLGILFLILYTKLIIKRKIIVKHLLLAFFLFIGIQAFQAFPQINSIFSSGSAINSTVFSNEGKFDRGLSYFSAIAPSIKASINLLGFPQMKDLSPFTWIFMIFPFIIVSSFLLNKKKTVLLTAFFFLVVLFFATANITDIWLSFYKSLFNIPGFSMFRNFYGQWQYSYIFFYSIFFGQALYIVLDKLKKNYTYPILFFLALILTVNAIPFITGESVRKPLWQSENVKEILQMDPDYEKALTFIRLLPADARVLTLPMSDPGYQVVAGKSGGAYMGPSTIAYLTGKKDFAGTEEFNEYKKVMLRLVRNKQYDTLKRMLGFLNIKYIFYNADPKVYEKFPSFPYLEVRKFLPSDQKSYKEFVQNLQFKEIKNINNKFFVFELQNNDYLPQIFIAKKSLHFNKQIAEIQTPLSLDETDNRLAIYNYGVIPISPEVKFDESLTDIRSKSSLLDFLISTEDSKFGFPFSSWKVTSLIYPYIVFREKQELASYKQVDKTYIDRRIFLAQKRIAELERWGKEFWVLGNVKSIDYLGKSWQKPNVLEAVIFQKYNFWEISFVRYQRAMYELIDKIEKISESERYFIVNKDRVRRAISTDREILYRIIQYNEKLSEKQKIYLLKLSIDMFGSIKNRLEFKMPLSEKVTYSLRGLSTGKYDLFIDTKSMQNYDQSKSRVIINDKELSFGDFQQENDWLKGQDITIKENFKSSLTFLLPSPINLTSETKWKSVEEGYLATDSASLTINDANITDNSGLIRGVANWNPMSHYILSFDYITYGKTFELSFYDKELGEEGKVSKILGDELKSSEWKTYSSVVASGNDASSAFIQIMKPANSDLFNQIEIQKQITRIDVRNLSVTQVPNPKIILRKIITNNDNLPKLTFTRINPIKYEVNIRDATAQYTLVLVEAFNSKWRLVDPARETNTVKGFFSRFIANIGKRIIGILVKETGDKNMTLSYFGGEVSENENKNIFLDKNTFDTWGKDEIAGDKHFAVNGYANAWYIDPEDMKGKKEYALILEMGTQKLFYVFLTISIVVLVTCILFLIKKLLIK